MEAIILAGGFGTRLAHIVKNVPKPMAPIMDKPFLSYILNYLSDYGIDTVIIATGYKHEIIQEYFGNKYKEINIIYSREIEPLGTGGAIKKALSLCNGNDIFVINGDTFFDVDLQEMYANHKKNNSNITIAVRLMKNFERYGSVIIQNQRIIDFLEKKTTKLGYINGGIYLLNKHILDDISAKTFSFEKDFMEKFTIDKNILAFKSNGYFIDIGVEEDYLRAIKELV